MKRTILVAVSALLTTSWSFSQYCTTGGPSSGADSNVGSIAMTGETTNLSYTGCSGGGGVTGVEDQTAQITDVIAGNTYSLDIDWGTCGGNFGNAATAWIDFNGDQVFETSEIVGTWTGTPVSGVQNYSFTVPVAAANGSHRIRVQQRESGSLPLDPCGSFTWGSVTDFTISITGGSSCNVPLALTLDAVDGFTADISWTAGGSETEWAIEWGPAGYTQGTGSTGSINSNTNPYEITGLTPTTAYDVYIAAICGPGDTSGYSGPLNFSTTVSCPQPTALVINASDLTSANIGWTAGGAEMEWEYDFGAVGFTPGAGTPAVTATNPQDLTGLASQQFFEFYVRAICGPGDTSLWSGPLLFNTYDQGIYMDWDSECGPGFFDISATGTNTGLTDDGEVGVALPFTLIYQGLPINDITIGDNGAIIFGTQTAQVGFGNGSTATAANGIYAFWDDLQPDGDNVYYETIGTAPNQQFIIQWNDHGLWPGGNGNGTWQIVIDEATNEIYTIYDDVEFNGGGQDFGGSATLGAAGPNQDIDVSVNNQTYLQGNSCIHYLYTDCPSPKNFNLTYATTDEIAFSWATGLAGENDWTIIYGPEGFDPLTGGTTVNTTANSAIIPGLDDATLYDVYIYADCDPGVLQSDAALTGQVATLPNCSDVTGIATATAVDSVFTTWNWIESSGVGTFPITGFDLEYGALGFDQGTGTIVNSDVNFDDTTFDASFLGGGVYEIYVQAICGTDSSFWTGPIQFTMPLTNDSTCLAEALNVDGTVYTFDNTGATIALNEGTIAPPATGFNTTDGWGDSNLDFTTWFTFDAPASGNVRFTGEDAGFDGQLAVYEVTTCDDFTSFMLLGANDDDVDGGSTAPRFSICGLTPGNTYYLMHDSQSTFATGQYSIAMTEIVVEAGTTNGILDVCTGDTVDLTNGIAGQDAGGSWVEAVNTANFADPIFPSAGLAFQVFDFEYFVVDGCAVDSVDQQVQIYGPSSAGNDGSLTVCQNEMFNLFSGLSGNVDLGGTWYDPTNTAITGSDVTAGTIPGTFNYDYIASNGVCPNDTSNVTIAVDPNCDILSIDDINFGNLNVYPNPSNGLVFISNYGSVEVFNYTVTDIKGKVVANKNAAINGEAVTEVNLNSLETGVYFINIFNDNSKGTFRVIIE